MTMAMAYNNNWINWGCNWIEARMGQLSRCKSAKWKRLGFGVHNENATLLPGYKCKPRQNAIRLSAARRNRRDPQSYIIKANVFYDWSRRIRVKYPGSFACRAMRQSGNLAIGQSCNYPIASRKRPHSASGQLISGMLPGWDPPLVASWPPL